MMAIRAGYRERLAWREQSREQTEKINAMISTHMDAMDRLDKRAAEENERWIASKAEENGRWVASKAEFDERMGKLAAAHVKFERRMDRLADRQEKFDEQMTASRIEFDARMDKLMIAQDKSDKNIVQLAEEHAATERSLKALLDGLQKGENGKPST